MEEVWKPVTIDPRYKISNLGRLQTQKGFIHDLKPHASGYIRAGIAGKTRFIHVLVALAFIPNDDPTRKTIVNHIDGIR